MKVISEFYSDDKRRRAVVAAYNGNFMVEMYESYRLDRFTAFNQLTLAEDMAEDWVSTKQPRLLNE